MSGFRWGVRSSIVLSGAPTGFTRLTACRAASALLLLCQNLIIEPL
jgi:hypothetical protein